MNGAAAAGLQGVGYNLRPAMAPHRIRRAERPTSGTMT